MDYVAHFQGELEAGRMNVRQILEGAEALRQKGSAGQSLQGMTPHQLIVLAKRIHDMVIAHEAKQIAF